MARLDFDKISAIEYNKVMKESKKTPEGPGKRIGNYTTPEGIEEFYDKNGILEVRVLLDGVTEEFNKDGKLIKRTNKEGKELPIASAPENAKSAKNSKASEEKKARPQKKQGGVPLENSEKGKPKNAKTASETESFDEKEAFQNINTIEELYNYLKKREQIRYWNGEVNGGYVIFKIKSLIHDQEVSIPKLRLQSYLKFINQIENVGLRNVIYRLLITNDPELKKETKKLKEKASSQPIPEENPKEETIKIELPPKPQEEKIETKTFSKDFIRDLIVTLLKSEGVIKEVKNINIRSGYDNMVLDVAVKAEMFFVSVDITLQAVLRNNAGSIKVTDLQIEANRVREKVESIIISKFSKTSEIIKNYIEKKEKKKVEKMEIINGELMVTFTAAELESVLVPDTTPKAQKVKRNTETIAEIKKIITDTEKLLERNRIRRETLMKELAGLKAKSEQERKEQIK